MSDEKKMGGKKPPTMVNAGNQKILFKEEGSETLVLFM